VHSLGGDLWKLRIELQNTGYLPTTGSKRSADRKVVRPLTAELQLPAGASVISAAAGNGGNGSSFGALPRIELGQLTGWSHKHTSVSFWPDTEPTSDIAVAEWVVKAPAGTEVPFTAKHPRAGVVRGRVRLV
jgi:hypothetical protein